MNKLKTSFCHSCSKWMEFPWLSKDDGFLYHQRCLPENIDKNKYDYLEKEKEITNEL